MKKVAGRLRLDLAQFRELEAFAAFGSDLDKASQAQLDRGARVVEMLKQPQYRPMAMEEQVVVIYAVTNGYMDSIPVDRVGAYESELLDTFRATQSHILNTIKSTGKLDSVEEQLSQALSDFTQLFNPEEN